MGCSVLPLLSAMTCHIPNIRCAAVQACPLISRRMRGNIADIQLRQNQGGQHLGGKGKAEQLQLGVDAAQQRQRHIHHHQQRDHRQRQAHAHREESGAQANQRFGGGAAENVGARRDSFEALREQAQHLAVQPHDEEQHAGHQLREHQQDAGIGLGVGVDGGGVGVARLQSEYLRGQREGFERDGDGDADRDAYGRLGERPSGEYRHGDGIAIGRRANGCRAPG